MFMYRCAHIFEEKEAMNLRGRKRMRNIGERKWSEEIIILKFN